jgi:hypothetical protein
MVKNTTLKLVGQVIFNMLGFLMIFFQSTWNFLTFANDISARLWVFFGFIFIIGGWAMGGSTNKQMIYRGLLSATLLFGVYFLSGGALFMYDALSNTNYSEGSLFIGFDALIGVSAVIGTVVNAFKIGFPIVVLAFTIISIFHAEDTGDYQSAILEGVMSTLFIIAFAFFGLL